MSGVIPDSMISLEMAVTQSNHPDPYYMLQFPSQVKVTGVSFTVNDSTFGDKGSGHTYRLYVQKGRKARAATQPGDEWAEDIAPFFGWDEKPTIHVDSSKFISDVVAPQEKGEWWAWGGPNYQADIAQMDTDEYLCIWVQGDEGNFMGYGNPYYDYPVGWNGPVDTRWDKIRAVVTIAYTGATNLG